MSQIVNRIVAEPIRKLEDYNEKWQSPDKGLIYCWEKGRELSLKEPELALKALNNELPVLVWKGGVADGLKMKKKYGSMHYLAMWHGLRNEDLEINLEKEYELTCSKNDVLVTFTFDSFKYLI